MFLSTRNQCFALLLVSGLIPTAALAAEGETSWDEGNLIANGRFAPNGTGELPEGWTVVAPNRALGPRFALVRKTSGGTQLSASGNGRDECFGFIKHPVRLEGGKTYRLRVRFKVEGLEDLNRHLVHAIYRPRFQRRRARVPARRRMDHRRAVVHRSGRQRGL